MQPSRKEGPGQAWGYVGGALGFRPPGQPGEPQQTHTNRAGELGVWGSGMAQDHVCTFLNGSW